MKMVTVVIRYIFVSVLYQWLGFPSCILFIVLTCCREGKVSNMPAGHGVHCFAPLGLRVFSHQPSVILNLISGQGHPFKCNDIGWIISSMPPLWKSLTATNVKALNKFKGMLLLR